MAAAPTFQTGSAKYARLNSVQVVVAGNINLERGELVYYLFEVAVSLP
jgi:hypothetical protein